ncbi:1-acyl-sn-glycerol-3-phosphate acyltransferase [bacterium]|nr:1-acyl-sn-glycerol-3-phosphate acyltransferase [bacterium]
MTVTSTPDMARHEAPLPSPGDALPPPLHKRPRGIWRARGRYAAVLLGYAVVTIPYAMMYFSFGFISRGLAYRLMQSWSHLLIALAGARLHVEGRFRPRWDRPCVVVGNHLSYLDFAVAFATVPIQVFFIATRGIRRIPIVGAAMARAGMMFIDRKSRHAAIATMRQAIDRIDAGAAVLSYPEGGISRDGTLGAFKSGLFRLAIEAGADVVPLVLRQTHTALDPINKTCAPGRIEAEFLDSVPTDGLVPAQAGELAAIVRERIAAAYGDGALRGVGRPLYVMPSVWGREKKK